MFENFSWAPLCLCLGGFLPRVAHRSVERGGGGGGTSSLPSLPPYPARLCVKLLWPAKPNIFFCIIEHPSSYAPKGRPYEFISPPPDIPPKMRNSNCSICSPCKERVKVPFGFWIKASKKSLALYEIVTMLHNSYRFAETEINHPWNSRQLAAL